MNESQLTDLLERAAEPLRPDTDRVVAGARTRGRALGRRRRALTAFGSLAAVAVLGVGATVTPHLGGMSAPTGADATGTRRVSLPSSPEALYDRVVALLPSGHVGPMITSAGLMSHSQPNGGSVVYFLFDGTVTEFFVSPLAGPADDDSCADPADNGDLGRPGEESGIRAMTCVADVAIGMESWNAKPVPATADSVEFVRIRDAPPLTRADFDAIVGNDVWFE